MKKALKPLIITVCALAVLGGAYLAMEYIFPEVEATPTPTPVPTEAPWSGLLIERDEATVAQVTLTRPGQGEWTLLPSIGEYGVRVFDVAGRSEFRYSQNALRNMVSRCFNMTVERVNSYTGELSDFGFGPGQTTARVILRDGTGYTILIGNATPDGRRYYVRLEGADGLFTATEAQVRPFLVDETRLRNMTLIPADERKPEDVARYAVLGGDRRNLDIVRRTREELETAEGAFPSELALAAPVIADISTDRLSELVLEDLEEGLWAVNVVEDHPADLSVYGLDEASATVMILNMQRRAEITLRFGHTVDGYTYVMFGDEPSVLRVEEAELTFLRRTYNELVAPFIWLYNIRDVKQIAYEYEGRRHVFSFNRVPDVDHWEFEGSIDGRQVSDTNISQLFMRSVDIRIGQELPASFRPGRPDMTVEMTFQNDMVRRMTLQYLNDRQIAIGVEGVYQFYAHVPDIDRLKTGIDLALAGQNLPRY